MTDGPPIVEALNLAYGAGGRTIIEVARWSVAPGEHTVVVGPSGSGKTTLLHMIAGLLTPTRGEIAVAGRKLGALSAAGRDLVRGRNVGIVFQNIHLIDALTVVDNLRLARFLARLGRDDRRVHALLDSLGVGNLAGQRPPRLSQGERQRVAIARALVNAPKLVIADEPTSALDDANCAQVLDLLFAQAEAHGATLLAATHDSRIVGRFSRRLALEKRA
jgi:putative ABC transport system ATP-binding protein